MHTHILVAQYVNGAHDANSRGDFQQAAIWCRQALQLVPDFPEALYNLGIALRGQAQSKEAIATFERVLPYTVNSADAQNSVGLQFLELGAYPLAEQCFERALALAPQYAFARSNLGMLRQKQKRYAEAEECFRLAIELAPDQALLYANLGATLNVQKKHEAAETVSRKALDLNPDLAAAWNNLGSALYGRKHYTAAEQTARRAVEIDPKSAEGWRTLGCALYGQKNYPEAVFCLRKSLELAPEADYLLGMLLHAKMRICDWQDLDSYLPRLIKMIEKGQRASPPFAILGLTSQRAIQQKAAEIWGESECPARSDLGPITIPAKHQKLRIAYYSADFHNHATTYLMAELFEKHDKNKVELIAFSFGPDKNDEMRQRVSAAFDRFIDVRAMSELEIARLSRELEIDIAVDLKGYTEDARSGIFSFRAAPIQVSYLGYPGTLGVSYIDYLIADPVLIPPEHFSDYSEKIVYMPHSYQVNDTRRLISARHLSRADHGLPDNAFVYCCFNNSYKITPEIFELWMRILARVDNSVLWLLEDNTTVAAHLRKEAEKRGIPSSRLIFAPRAPLDEHLARHRLADLFLDTTPYNAHTTASDALWAGLPIITLCGESFAGRVAASLVTAMGLPELVVNTTAAYETLALTLAADQNRLASIKQKLTDTRLTAPLFDIATFTANLEAAYRKMQERLGTGLAPDHIYKLS